MGVILDAIQSGAVRRVEASHRRKDITPIAQEPDFVDQEDEPEVTLPEGYDEMDFDDRKKTSDDTEESADSESSSENSSVQNEETEPASLNETSDDSEESSPEDSQQEED